MLYIIGKLYENLVPERELRRQIIPFWIEIFEDKWHLCRRRLLNDLIPDSLHFPTCYSS